HLQTFGHPDPVHTAKEPAPWERPRRTPRESKESAARSRLLVQSSASLESQTRRAGVAPGTRRLSRDVDLNPFVACALRRRNTDRWRCASIGLVLLLGQATWTPHRPRRFAASPVAAPLDRRSRKDIGHPR